MELTRAERQIDYVSDSEIKDTTVAAVQQLLRVCDRNAYAQHRRSRVNKSCLLDLLTTVGEQSKPTCTHAF